MKKIPFFLIILATIATACSKENDTPDDTPEELLLSISEKGTIVTEDLWYQFDILQGNGEYTFSFSDEKVADALLDGNSVQVRFKNFGKTELTVRDRENKSQTVHLFCNDLSLMTTEYICYIDIGMEETYELTFGKGGYYIYDSSGSSLAAWIEDSVLHVKTAVAGVTKISVANQWGTLQYFEFNVVRQK